MLLKIILAKWFILKILKRLFLLLENHLGISNHALLKSFIFSNALRLWLKLMILVLILTGELLVRLILRLHKLLADLRLLILRLNLTHVILIRV